MTARALGLALLLGCAQLGATSGVAFAQVKEEAKPPAAGFPGRLPRRDAAKKRASAAASMAPNAGMEVLPAPKTGSMPGKDSPAPKGRLGTEPARQGKLGTPPPENSKDRPPRPQ